MKVSYIDKIFADDLPTQFTPLLIEKVPVGFPSPANDYLETPIDLNKYLIKNPTATFLVRASGDSMIGINIGDQAVLVVDRSIKPTHNSVVVASLDGDFLCKKLQMKPRIALISENPNYPPVYIGYGQDLNIIGTVTAAINKF
tara:strand:+ start:652 stop:1080 length:429 start_codon:yes stop_codon:yes gene_type:complete